MVVMHDANAQVTWDGNLVDGASGLAANPGIKSVSLNLTSDGYIMRPQASVLINNSASTAMSYVNEDIDLQERPASGRHVGCDQVLEAPVLNRPKSRSEVGVQYEGNTSAQVRESNVEPFFIAHTAGSRLSVSFNELAHRSLALFTVDGRMVGTAEGYGSSYNVPLIGTSGIFLLRVLKDNLIQTYKIGI